MCGTCVLEPTNPEERHCRRHTEKESWVRINTKLNDGPGRHYREPRRHLREQLVRSVAANEVSARVRPYRVRNNRIRVEGGKNLARVPVIDRHAFGLVVRLHCVRCIIRW